MRGSHSNITIGLCLYMYRMCFQKISLRMCRYDTKGPGVRCLTTHLLLSRHLSLGLSGAWEKDAGCVCYDGEPHPSSAVPVWRQCYPDKGAPAPGRGGGGEGCVEKRTGPHPFAKWKRPHVSPFSTPTFSQTWCYCYFLSPPTLKIQPAMPGKPRIST